MSHGGVIAAFAMAFAIVTAADASADGFLENVRRAAGR
jgi:hypothetical protein